MAPQDAPRAETAVAGPARDGERHPPPPPQQQQQQQPEEPPPPQKELYPMVNWKYDLFLYVMGNLVDLFFREVVPRGSWRVPQSGPVLFVAAPHANQVRRRRWGRGGALPPPPPPLVPSRPR